MNTTAQRLVDDYLTRLRAAAADLPSDRRAEVLADISEHIAAAQHDGMTDEAQIRRVLDRLGEPADIVASAAPDGHGVQPKDSGRGGAEIAAVSLFLVAEVLFVLVPLSLAAWIVALVLLVRSRRWTLGEKLLAGGILAPGFWLIAVAGTLVARTGSGVACTAQMTAGGRVVGQPTCTDAGASTLDYVAWALLAAYLLAQAVVAWRLVRSARRPA